MAAFARSALHGLLLSTSLISLAALPAFAQSADSSAASEYDLPEVVITANQVPVDASKVGSSVTVVSGEELRANGITTLPDALREVAGIAVGTTGQRGGLTEVRMRGMKPNHLLVQVDGVQVNDVSNGAFDFAGFLIDDIERVEVLRGPQSGLYGANAQAGVISVITKSGRGLAKPEVTAKAEAGTRNSGSGAASVRGAVGPVYGSLTVSDVSTRGFNASRSGPETDGSRAAVVSGKGGIDFNDYFNVEGSLRWTDRFTKLDNNDFATGLLVDTADTQGNDSFTGNVVATAKLWDGHYTQTIGASTYESNYLWQSPTYGAYKYTGKRDTFDTKGALKFDTPWLAGATHTLSLGANYEQEEYQQSNSPGETYARQSTGLFAEHLMSLPFGLSLSAAVRHDDFEVFKDADTWRLTASQSFATATRLHASVGTGVTKPTFVQQLAYIPSVSFIGNPGLKPEHSTGWDAGIEQTLIEGKLVADVTYFWLDLTDEIRTAYTAFGTTVVNSPQTTHRQGVEVALRAELLPWLTVDGTYTYTDAEAYDTGLDTILGATRIPQNALSARVTAKFADGRGQASVAVVYNGAMTDAFTSNYWSTYNRVALEDYTVVNAIVSYDLSPTTTFYVRGDNLFDEKYEEVFSYVAPGRVVYAGLKVKLGGEAAPAVTK
jgi:vitamin B12 transporter